MHKSPRLRTLAESRAWGAGVGPFQQARPRWLLVQQETEALAGWTEPRDRGRAQGGLVISGTPEHKLSRMLQAEAAGTASRWVVSLVGRGLAGTDGLPPPLPRASLEEQHQGF